jgi:hypothetical protein
MSDQPARPADAFAQPMNQYFGTSGRQLENDNWMQKIPLERSGRKTPGDAMGLPGSTRSMPAATRSRLRQGHGGDGKQQVLWGFYAMFHNISYANRGDGYSRPQMPFRPRSQSFPARCSISGVIGMMDKMDVPKYPRHDPCRDNPS